MATSKVVTVTAASVGTGDTLASYNIYSDQDGLLDNASVAEATAGHTVSLSDGVVHSVTVKPVGTSSGEYNAASNAVEVDLSAPASYALQFRSTFSEEATGPTYADGVASGFYKRIKFKLTSTIASQQLWGQWGASWLCGTITGGSYDFSYDSAATRKVIKAVPVVGTIYESEVFYNGTNIIIHLDGVEILNTAFTEVATKGSTVEKLARQTSGYADVIIYELEDEDGVYTFSGSGSTLSNGTTTFTLSTTDSVANMWVAV